MGVLESSQYPLLIFVQHCNTMTAFFIVCGYSSDVLYLTEVLHEMSCPRPSRY